MARNTRKSTVTVGKSGFATGIKRTDEEWDQLFADTILPALRNGATMQSQREQYGRSECIRMAARRAGYASIADAIKGDATFTTIKVGKGVQSKVAAKRINDARLAGASWNTLKLATSLELDQLKALLRQHGYDTVVTGRVALSARAKAAQAKKEAEAAKPVKRTRRTRKAVNA